MAYSNNTAPFVDLDTDLNWGDSKCGGLNTSINGHFTDATIELVPLAKLAIADTFHDLCQPRKGYEPSIFRSKILETILPLAPEQNGDEMYGEALQNLFEGTVSKSSLEEHVNRYFEDHYNLQPIYTLLNTITYDDIIKYQTQPGDRETMQKKLQFANGSLKLVVPEEFSSFTEYMGQFTEADRLLNQRLLSKFISSFLHGNLDLHTRPTEIIIPTRFLFDAGGSNIAKIYRHPGSNGIRYNAMACTADSAGSSDDMLDPDQPNEYEAGISGQVIDVTTNFLTCDKFKMYYKVNPGKTFGVDGTKCFSVNFRDTMIDNPRIDQIASYYFGSKKKRKEFR